MKILIEMMKLLLLSVIGFSGLAACGGGGGGTPTPGDNTPPTVTATTPAANATGVAVTTLVTATFSETIDSFLLINGSFTLSDGLGVENGTISYNATTRTATFTSDFDLAENTLYTATIMADLADLAGNALTSDFIWNFTTGPSTPVDNTPPTVTATTPAANATGVAVTSPVTVTFSEPIDSFLLINGSFTLSDSLGAENGTISYNATTRTATFTSDFDLAENTLYTATIMADLADLAGNTLTSDFIWNFTTGTSTPVDNTPPTVTATIPTANATGVAVTSPVTVTFSEDMNPATLGILEVIMLDENGAPAGVPVLGNQIFNGTDTITYTPDSGQINAGTKYQATLRLGPTDLAGNPLLAAVVWNFTTASPPPPPPPLVP